jgi:hypothetical protein
MSKWEQWCGVDNKSFFLGAEPIKKKHPGIFCK